MVTKRDFTISIHAPHTGRDPPASWWPCTAPREISIHAPHTGRDGWAIRCSSRRRNFNPRAPYGARLCMSRPVKPILEFQSTRPIRGATCTRPSRWPGSDNFNPRAPYGARRPPAPPAGYSRHFNPRAPYGARLADKIPNLRHHVNFNPRAPYGARPMTPSAVTLRLLHFNPRAPYGARPYSSATALCTTRTDFNPRAPYGARLP